MMAPNSCERSTAWNGIPRWAATMRASRASPMEQHDFLAASDSSTWTPLRMKRPTSGRPSRWRSHAATELSTPPLMATTVRPSAPVASGGAPSIPARGRFGERGVREDDPTWSKAIRYEPTR